MSEFPDIPYIINTSEGDVVKEIYEPCLSWAIKYDRGVGYFTSGWLKENAKGMAKFAEKNGKARWIASPILEEKDFDAITKNDVFNNDMLEKILEINIEEIANELENNTLNALAWLIYDGIIEFKFAIPNNKLSGDFHDKFGIFYDELENKIAFSGSINDSAKGFTNYESIKTFTTEHEIMEKYVNYEVNRFNKLWSNTDNNLRVYDIPTGLKEKIFKLRKSERPYNFKAASLEESKWQHQKDAEDIFIDKKSGILAMATGTGKTRTAINIINRLIKENKIKKIIISVAGTDLLDQWCKEIRKNTPLKVYRYYELNKELANFLYDPNFAVLIVSRSSFLIESIKFTKKGLKENSLIVFDEVHGLGAEQFINSLEGKISGFKYRLGLSATPERDYDEAGNLFIEEEVGNVIYEFSIEDAIKKGILCEFDYVPLNYSLTQEDKQRIKKIIAAFNTKKKLGQSLNYEEFYRNLANVKKISLGKVPIFEKFIKSNREIFKKCIIFVETKEFGSVIQDIIMNYNKNFHTYYGEDNRNNLNRFSKGELDCLITSKRISEGIDISSVENIILFSADKSKIQTIQRIGRALRLDHKNQHKKARVIDFVESSEEVTTNTQEKADIKRKEWLMELSNIRKEK